MKKTRYAVGVAVLLAALLAFAGVGQCAMWVGAEFGGNWATGNAETNIYGVPFSAKTNFDGSVIGGAIIGYDFVNSGFGAYAWPDWMKYFSIATDITYNNLRLKSLGDVTVGRNNLGSVNVGLDGFCVAWTFLFMAHYGLFPDSIVPSGRVNPYIGVGPAIVWTAFDAYVALPSSTNVALVVEPGIRWMVFKHVSIDTAFRWRYCSPSYSEDGISIDMNPLHQFTFLVRANYHF